MQPPPHSLTLVSLGRVLATESATIAAADGYGR